MDTRMADAFAALQPFISPLPRGSARCELCAAPIGETHAHVVAFADARIACACGACAILFRDRGAGGGRYRTVPTRVLVDARFAPSDAEWNALAIPVRLAYLVRRGETWVACLPSPGGAVEAPLSAAAATVLARAMPLAADVEPDVEALLLQRPRTGAADCLLVPIDVCHRLTALVRRHWRGFSGGQQAEGEIEAFVADLRARARQVRP
jgi:hypothetical protein